MVLSKHFGAGLRFQKFEDFKAGFHNGIIFSQDIINVSWMAKKDNVIGNAFYAKVGEAEPNYLAWSADGKNFDALLGADDG